MGVKFTEGSLGKVNVEILSPTNVTLRCTECGQVWSPNLGRNGRLPRGWWKCPHCYDPLYRFVRR